MAHKKGFIKPFTFSDSGAGDKKWEKFQKNFGVLIAWFIFTVGFAAVNKVWSFFSEREFWIILILSFSLLTVLSYSVLWVNRWSRKIAYLATAILLVFTLWKLVDKTFPGVLPEVKAIPRALWDFAEMNTTKIRLVERGFNQPIYIPLLSENKPSDLAINLDVAPAGWFYRFEGPSEAKVHFSDGTVGPITKNYGVKGGHIRFSGPVGQEIVVRFIPSK